MRWPASSRLRGLLGGVAQPRSRWRPIRAGARCPTGRGCETLASTASRWVCSRCAMRSSTRWRAGTRPPRAGLRAAVALEPDHLSLYALQLALAPDEWAAPPRPGALRWRRRMVDRQDD